MDEIEDVLLEKGERLERLNEVLVNLASGIINIPSNLSFNDQIKYGSIGEFCYLMDVTGRSKAYGVYGKNEES